MDSKILNIIQYESEIKSRSFEAVEYESQPPEPEQQANLELKVIHIF